MRKRIQFGTDIATIGAWDSVHSSPNIVSGREDALDADACEGGVFLVHTGADCGGALDVYVESELPEDVAERSTSIGGEFLLRSSSGQVIFGGAEDYRSGTPKITGEDSIIKITPGDYGVQCYQVEPSKREPDPHEILEEWVGADEVAYFNQVNGRVWRFALATLLLLPLLTCLWNWMIALPVTLFAFFSAFHLSEHVLKSNTRYQRIERRFSAAWEECPKRESPLFVFQLRLLNGNEVLTGGQVRIG